jgi:hypothetical protein
MSKTQANIRIEDMVVVVREALRHCQEAYEAYTAPTLPETPQGRVRWFKHRIGDAMLEYPAVTYGDRLVLNAICVKSGGALGSVEVLYFTARDADIARVVRHLRGYPSRVLALVRWLECIERWLRARAKGRQRHAEEILRQQQRAIAEIKNRATAARLMNSP